MGVGVFIFEARKDINILATALTVTSSTNISTLGGSTVPNDLGSGLANMSDIFEALNATSGLVGNNSLNESVTARSDLADMGFDLHEWKIPEGYEEFSHHDWSTDGVNNSGMECFWVCEKTLGEGAIVRKKRQSSPPEGKKCTLVCPRSLDGGAVYRKKRQAYLFKSGQNSGISKSTESRLVRGRNNYQKYDLMSSKEANHLESNAWKNVPRELHLSGPELAYDKEMKRVKTIELLPSSFVHVPRFAGYIGNVLLKGGIVSNIPLNEKWAFLKTNWKSFEDMVNSIKSAAKAHGLDDFDGDCMNELGHIHDGCEKSTAEEKISLVAFWRVARILSIVRIPAKLTNFEKKMDGISFAFGATFIQDAPQEKFLELANDPYFKRAADEFMEYVEKNNLKHRKDHEEMRKLFDGKLDENARKVRGHELMKLPPSRLKLIEGSQCYQ